MSVLLILALGSAGPQVCLSVSHHKVCLGRLRAVVCLVFVLVSYESFKKLRNSFQISDQLEKCKVHTDCVEGAMCIRLPNGGCKCIPSSLLSKQNVTHCNSIGLTKHRTGRDGESPFETGTIG